MKRFDVSKEDRVAMAEWHRDFQTAVAVLANRSFGIDPINPRGISKYEGGVSVNDREIAIQDRYVIDDWRKPSEETREEIAVVQAIKEVIKGFRNEGGAYFAPFRNDPIKDGDALRAFFDFR